MPKRSRTRQLVLRRVAQVQRNGGAKGVDLSRSVGDWVHIFREHNKEADAWAAKGVRGRIDNGEDDSNVVWSEVAGLCGFRAGRDDVCGAGMWIKIFTQALEVA